MAAVSVTSLKTEPGTKVELKSGEDSVASAFAEALAAEFDLKEQPKSKLARAMAL